jgi:hypothetical protein
MLATFLIEFGLLFYTLWRYKMTPVSRLVVAFLTSLGIFQLAEYMICGGLGLGHSEWIQIGYVAITLLPAFGLHLVVTLAKKSVSPLVYTAYMTAAAYAVYFIAFSSTVIAHECAPNYAIFAMDGYGYFFYGLYYYGWLLLTAGLAVRWSRQRPKQAPALRWMVAGYAAFIIPTSIANSIDPATISAIPSIKCGFAVLFAVILVWRVMPLANVPVRHTRGVKRKT